MRASAASIQRKWRMPPTCCAASAASSASRSSGSSTSWPRSCAWWIASSCSITAKRSPRGRRARSPTIRASSRRTSARRSRWNDSPGTSARPPAVQAVHTSSARPPAVQAAHTSSARPPAVRAVHTSSARPPAVQAAHTSSARPPAVRAGHAAPTMTMLALRHVTAGYGHFTALWDVSLEIAAGEAVAVVGPNGAGKTTLLRVISGVIAPRSGELIFESALLTGRPAHEIVAHGIAHVPEGRRLFPPLTVAENLQMGAFLPAPRRSYRQSLERVFELFPVLAERRGQRAGSLSGGEQQMLALGRALMSTPRLILLDEPSMGPAPVMVVRLFDLIRRIRAAGYTILVVVQNVRQVLKLVDRAYLP